jgi:hypothetical protein
MTTQLDLIRSINESLYIIVAHTESNAALHAIDSFAGIFVEQGELDFVTRRKGKGKPAISKKEFLDGLDALGLFKK